MDKLLCSYCFKENAVLLRCKQCNKLYCRQCMPNDIMCFVCNIVWTKMKNYREENHENKGKQVR